MEISKDHITDVLIKRGYTEISISVIYENTYTIWAVNPNNNHDIVGRSSISYGHALLEFFKNKYNVH